MRQTEEREIKNLPNLENLKVSIRLTNHLETSYSK